MAKPTVSTPQAGEPGPLLELLPGVNLAQFYAQQTGLKPDPNHFGIYAIEPVGSALYLGFGTARPSECNGALLARTDGVGVRAIYQPPEQGFIGMHSNGAGLCFPGADPTEDWSMGNVYTGTGNPPDNIVKHRTLPNVVHTLGLCTDATTGRLYAAVSRHNGDGQTFSGGVMISDDQGENWQMARDPKHILGKYRTYDIAQFGDSLYVTANDDYRKPTALAASSNGGESWKRIHVKVEGRPRLMASRDYLVAQGARGAGLVLINSRGKAVRTRFRGFAAAEWSYNYICAGYGGWYYLLASSGRIYNSRDLVNWTLVAETGLSLLAVGYWQTKNWLIVADRGENASLWYLDLAQYGAV